MKESKSNRVPVQKGKIDCNIPTMKTITPEQTAKNDHLMRKDRFDGQTLKFHTPKR